METMEKMLLKRMYPALLGSALLFGVTACNDDEGSDTPSPDGF